MVIKHRKSIRLKKYDYCDAGWYFVTTCTNDKKEVFGEIMNNRMVLNKNGVLIKSNWENLINKFIIELDDFIIMPNHVHGIVIIRQSNVVGVSFMKPSIIDKHELNNKTKIIISKTNHHMKLLNNKKGLINQTPTIGLIIRHFKSKCTYELHKNGFTNDLWQRNYYEHIIRNEPDLYRIRQYIRDNPKNWENDSNNLLQKYKRENS
jgi:putative transposase